jgi:DNA-directed RNA polymerase specialized sigma subunit
VPRADDLAEIRKAGRRHASARARLAKAEADRDRVIREVYARGNVKHTEIADAIGVSFQRVSQILAKN